MKIPYILLISTCASFCASVAFIGLLIRLSHRFKWYDDVDHHRKIHSGEIPRIGGLGIFIAFFIGLLVFFILYITSSAALSINGIVEYIPVLAGCVIILTAGLADDFTSMRARYKFIFQLIAAAIVAGFGFIIKDISLPGLGISFSLGPFGYAFTIFWIVGMSNAVNLIDGMDGLAGGITSITALFIGIISMLNGDVLIAVFALSLFAGTVGFLVYNFPPAKIFMGDSGSLFLGFVIALIPLLKRSGPSSTYTLIAVFTLMLIPILDTLEAIIRRTNNKIPFHKADQNHLHHKLLRVGLSNRQILLVVYFMTGIAGAAALLWGLLDAQVWGITIFVSWLLSGLLFIILDIRNRKLNGNSSPPIKGEQINPGK